MLEGKKTYGFAGLSMVSTVIFILGWIDQPTLIALLGIFGPGAIISERIAIKKLGQPVGSSATEEYKAGTK